MIERITSVDIYSHLRLEVAVHTGARHRNAATERGPPAGAGAENATLDLESRERRRLPAPEDPGEAGVIRYEQSSTGDDSRFGYTGDAEELRPALEASVVPRDWRLAQAARVYNRAGRSATAGRAANLGTRLDAVA